MSHASVLATAPWNFRCDYSTGADLCDAFVTGRDSSCLLAFLLTANHEAAERCFVAALDQAIKANAVFKEWVTSWIRRPFRVFRGGLVEVAGNGNNAFFGGQMVLLVDYLYLLRPMVRSRMKRISGLLRSLSVIMLASLVFQGCNAVNPLCGSARPAPIIGSLSASTITLAEVQEGFVLNVYGARFVSSSVVVINGTNLNTLVTSSTQLQVTITDALISAPGTASVTVNTPSGTSGDLGCSSGGTSGALALTIT